MTLFWPAEAMVDEVVGLIPPGVSCSGEIMVSVTNEAGELRVAGQRAYINWYRVSVRCDTRVLYTYDWADSILLGPRIN